MLFHATAPQLTQQALSPTLARHFSWKRNNGPLELPQMLTNTLTCFPSALYTLASAFSRMEHVLYTRTSAFEGSSVHSKPSASRHPAIRSESAMFICSTGGGKERA